MRARTKGNWEAGARGRRRTPWTAVAASSPVRAIEDPVAQIAWEIVARVAEIASVTAAFLQGAGQGEEELLVAAPVGRAEPTHEQAVRAAHPAWGPVVVDGVAAADGGNQPIVEEKQMKKKTILIACSISVASIVFAHSASIAMPRREGLQTSHATEGTSQPSQKAFTTPKEAADALVQAAASFNVPSLKEILGPDSEDLVSSEDPVQDKNRAVAFAALAREKSSIAVGPKNPNRAVLLVGNDDWPLPIPIVKKEGKWIFDAKTGRKEILVRRIGANELDVIQICRGYVEAQKQYAQEKHDGSEVNQYAQRIISTSGKQDGLAWQNADGSWGGPVGEGVAKALAQGYTSRSQPYRGYFFKILKGQGPAAPLGEMDFVVNGAMIGGFALAAAPAEYRVTGVQTFIVSFEGIVYQKDLGPDTLRIFKDMQLYNPDKTWTRTDDNW